MRIVVCIKQVPDTTRVRIDPVTHNLVREGVPSVLNPFDRTAIETALRLRDEVGGTVCVLSMGPPQAEKELQLALDLGADRAVLLCSRALGGADTLATSYALAQTIRELGFDLILCGNEAIDGCTGQVGPAIGEHLAIPSFTCVDEISLEGDTLILRRDTGKSLDTWRTALPAVACLLRAQATRTPSPSQRRPEQMDASHLEEERIGSRGSPTRVAAISTSERQSNLLEVDYRWSLDERMEYIFNGGLVSKGTKLTLGPAEKQATLIRDKLTGGAGA